MKPSGIRLFSYLLPQLFYGCFIKQLSDSPGKYKNFLSNKDSGNFPKRSEKLPLQTTKCKQILMDIFYNRGHIMKFFKIFVDVRFTTSNAVHDIYQKNTVERLNTYDLRKLKIQKNLKLGPRQRLVPNLPSRNKT